MAWDKLFNREGSARAKEAAVAEPETRAPSSDLNASETKRDTRRSKRVYISMPVLVKLQRGAELYEERTATEAVNAQGCSLRLNVAVEREQRMTIVNVKSAQEVECRVVFVGQSEGGKTKAGVEFTRPAEYFWHIAFPPDDWNPADRRRPIIDRALTQPSLRRA
ncbi:MAG TPA: hypothetical protein VKB26_03840 [Candidatus Acidoferrales bacterium]|nr:hypothetical protein [Candidatus Acidoferrales bacterium]